MLLAEACFYALLWVALVPTECGVWRWRDRLRAAQLRKSALRAGDLEKKPIPFEQLLRGKQKAQARADAVKALEPVVLALRQPSALLRGSRYESDLSALAAFDGLLESELAASVAVRHLEASLYDSTARGQRSRTPSGEPRHVAFADVWWDIVCDDHVRAQMITLISLDPSVSSAAAAKELSSLRQRQTRAAQRKPPSPSPAARLQLVDETLRAERERGFEEQREQAQAENARLRGRMERQDAELDATTEELSRLLGVKDAEIERLQGLLVKAEQAAFGSSDLESLADSLHALCKQRTADNPSELVPLATRDLANADEKALRKLRMMAALDEEMLRAALEANPGIRAKLRALLRLPPVGSNRRQSAGSETREKKESRKEIKGLVLLLALARVNQPTEEETCVLPWTVGGALVSLATPERSINFSKHLSSLTVGAKNLADFLQQCASAITNLYHQWWPEEELGLIVDNINMHDRYARQLLSKLNSIETNRLLNAAFACVFKLRQPRWSRSLLHHRPVERISAAVDFRVTASDAAAGSATAGLEQPLYRALDELFANGGSAANAALGLGGGTVSRLEHYVQRILHKYRTQLLADCEGVEAVDAVRRVGWEEVDVRGITVKCDAQEVRPMRIFYVHTGSSTAVSEWICELQRLLGAGPGAVHPSHRELYVGGDFLLVQSHLVGASLDRDDAALTAAASAGAGAASARRKRVEDLRTRRDVEQYVDARPKGTTKLGALMEVGALLGASKVFLGPAAATAADKARQDGKSTAFEATRVDVNGKVVALKWDSAARTLAERYVMIAKLLRDKYPGQTAAAAAAPSAAATTTAKVLRTLKLQQPHVYTPPESCPAFKGLDGTADGLSDVTYLLDSLPDGGLPRSHLKQYLDELERMRGRARPAERFRWLLAWLARARSRARAARDSCRGAVAGLREAERLRRAEIARQRAVASPVAAAVVPGLELRANRAAAAAGRAADLERGFEVALDAVRAHMQRATPLLEAAVAAEVAAAGGAAAGSSDAEAARDEARAKLHRPQLLHTHSLDGLLHKLRFGGLSAAFNSGLWETGLAYFTNRLRKKGVSKKIEKFTPCHQLFYFVHLGACFAMLQAHMASGEYAECVSAAAGAPLSTQQRSASFVRWGRARMASGDEVFRHYAQFGFGGLAMLYRVTEHCIGVDDGIMLAALILPYMGWFDMAGRYNLKRQCLWQLCKLISSSEEVALKMMANFCINTSGDVAAFTGLDDALERMIKLAKSFKPSGNWTEARAEWATALPTVLRDLLGNLQGAVGGARRRGGHTSKRAAEIVSVVAKTFASERVFEVSGDPVGGFEPRRLQDFKSNLICSGYVVPEKFKCPLNLFGANDTTAQGIYQAAFEYARRALAEAGQADSTVQPEAPLPSAAQADVSGMASDGGPGAGAAAATIGEGDGARACDCCQDLLPDPHFTCSACEGDEPHEICNKCAKMVEDLTVEAGPGRTVMCPSCFSTHMRGGAPAPCGADADDAWDEDEMEQLLLGEAAAPAEEDAPVEGV